MSERTSRLKRLVIDKLIAIGIFSTIPVAQTYVNSLSQGDLLQLSQHVLDLKGKKAIFVASATRDGGKGRTQKPDTENV